MKKTDMSRYKSTADLRQVLSSLSKQKYTLDCGHHVTFNEALGSNIMIYNGKKLKIVCSMCSY